MEYPHNSQKQMYVCVCVCVCRGAATDSGPPGQHIHSGPPADGRGGGGLVGFPLRTDQVPVESPSVEIAIAFSAEPCTRASNLGPGPRCSGPCPARVRQLNRITSPSPTLGCLFFVPSPKSDYTVSAIKIVRFCM